jgi:hypothetical protein
MLGCGNSSRTGYPLHGLYTPQTIPDTSLLYESCSCQSNLLPVAGIYLPMNEILFMLFVVFEEIDFLPQKCQSLLTRTFVLLQECVFLSAKLKHWRTQMSSFDMTSIPVT